jgi:hypothetical protein
MNIIDRSPTKKTWRRRIVLLVLAEIIYLTVTPPAVVFLGYGHILRTPLSALSAPEGIAAWLLVTIALLPICLLVVQTTHYVFPIRRSDVYSLTDDLEEEER